MLQLALVLEGASSQTAHGLGTAWSIGLLKAPVIECAKDWLMQPHNNLFAGTCGSWSPGFFALVVASTN